MLANSNPSFWIFLPIIVVVVALSVSVRGVRSLSIIEMWAAENGFEVLKAKRCLFFPTPFIFRHTKNQTIYRITVRDREGTVRNGYLRCGGFFGGLWSNKATVEWD